MVLPGDEVRDLRGGEVVDGVEPGGREAARLGGGTCRDLRGGAQVRVCGEHRVMRVTGPRAQPVPLTRVSRGSPEVSRVSRPGETMRSTGPVSAARARAPPRAAISAVLPRMAVGAARVASASRDRRNLVR